MRHSPLSLGESDYGLLQNWQIGLELVVQNWINGRKQKRGKMPKNGRLILEAKADERFILYDSISGLTTIIKPFFRNNDNLAIAFEAPSQVRISREKQRTVEQRSVNNGDRKTD